jgi:hypothetical protein
MPGPIPHLRRHRTACSPLDDLLAAREAAGFTGRLQITLDFRSGSLRHCSYTEVNSITLAA